VNIPDFYGYKSARHRLFLAAIFNQGIAIGTKRQLKANTGQQLLDKGANWIEKVRSLCT
jgi:hypothetical protein